jgi:hypothetical protein
MLALGITGCVVNGKKVFGLGDLSSSSPGSTSSPAPAVETSQPSAQPAQTSSQTAQAKQANAPRPEWCAKAGDLDGDLDQALGDDFDRSLPSIVGTICNPRDDKQREQRAAVEANRQGWMKRLGMTESEWASDVIEWVKIPLVNRNSPKVDPTGGVWSTLGPVQQFALLDGRAGEGHYIADALTLTQAGRVAYLSSCIRTRYSTEDNKPLDWAACLPDVDRLDGAALGKELRGDKQSTGKERMTVRRAFALLQARLPKFKAAIDKLVADPTYAKQFETAKTAAEAWTRGAKDRTDLLALVRTADDVRTGDAAALAGCAARTRDPLVAAIRGIDMNGFAAEATGEKLHATLFRPILDSIDGYLAANAYAGCNSATEALADAFGLAVSANPGYRGPRTAALSAMFEAGAHVDINSEQFEFAITLIGARYPSVKVSSSRGVIAKVNRKGDRITIGFPSKSHVENPCDKWVRTNRVVQLTDSGQLIYEERCTKRHKQRVDDTPSSITVDARYAAGLEPGAYVVPGDGYILAVWSDATAKRPKVVLGVELE